ncbi:complement factor H-related protein 1-like isoform X2 [Rhineura floridana]|uniref:complement factor H-related protein 1-like isoform X2 n=1 Tax=Rhineura floridana TaxID=261503 RepID=UPI002AC88C0B|nr:complement factor H-related protein 1-like isoform X2 [Rhineura floridana]
MKSWLVCFIPFLLWICCASQNVCEEPPDIDFGEIVSGGDKAEYRTGDRIQYRCYPGYTLEGSEWITCRHKWILPPKWTFPPKCLAPCRITKQQLDAKHLIFPGGRSYSRFIQNGYSLEFLCREGYVLTNSSVGQCVDGHVDLPSCTSAGLEEGCSRPPSIENGDILDMPLTRYISGATVKYKCQRLYIMRGSPVVSCNNGGWTETPVCLEACTVTAEDMNRYHIQMRWTAREKIYAQSGDVLEFSCKQGHEKDPSSPSFRPTCVEGKLQYPRCV